jgi:uncharacterized membrane protein YsdA (DUF1294 family)/cold shock CspA family protein
MRKKGTVANWNGDKGYGFIDPSAGGKSVFFHHTAFDKRRWQPQSNDVVTYALSKDKQGRPCAVNVSTDTARPAKRRGQTLGLILICFAVGFLTTVCILSAKEKVPVMVSVFYLLISLITFMIYAKDKTAAKRDSWRTPENTLHMLALIGGWPGALLAHKLLRHKSSINPEKPRSR